MRNLTIYTVKASANNLNDDVNFKHIIEHALSCTLERVDKDVSNMGGLRFGTVDESCLIKATRKEADCEWLDQALDRVVPSSTGGAEFPEQVSSFTGSLLDRAR